MRSAALETSSRRPSVAVRDGERVVSRALDGDRPHASDLLPALEAALTELGLGPADIEAVAVGTGPGSYTGLRVGIATALGIARGSDAQLVGVPSLEALAWGQLEPGEEAGVLLDARARELYFAHYRRATAAAELEVITPPCVIARDELGPRLPAGLMLFADDAALRAAGLEGDESRRIRSAHAHAEQVLELGLARLASTGPQLPAEIEPLYLRAFAAQPRKR